jgi:hypothetical protein
MVRSTRLSGSLAIILLCLSVLTVAAAEETGLKSNLDLLSDLSNRVANDLISDFRSQLSPNSAIWLVPFSDGENYVFLANELTAALSAQKIRSYPPGPLVTPDSTSAASSGLNSRPMKLEFQALEFNLAYPKVFRSYLIGGKQVSRRADVKVYARLLDPDDESVIWVGEASRSHKDQFPYSARSEVEAGLFEFTKPPVNPPSWGKIIEPVVVSGIIVGLVYLFYSNQSDN